MGLRARRWPSLLQYLTIDGFGEPSYIPVQIKQLTRPGSKAYESPLELRV